MAKFNTVDKRRRPAASGPIATTQTPTGTTYNGAPGYEYETLSQLFLLTCANMVSEDTFYEKASDRDKRFTQLIQAAVKEGHSEWLTRFLPWVRNTANMRSAAVTGAAIATKAMLDAKIPGGRKLINSVLTRADEPGEFLAYWAQTWGHKLPKPVKRGLADAVRRLYTERNVLKYDTMGKGFRFGDVIELTHPAPASPDQGDLFQYLLARGHRREDVQIADTLPMIIANEALRRAAASTPEVLLNTARLRQAGMTWEAAKSLAGTTVSDKDFWEIMIPEMGYMALLRNLRNFDEAGISSAMIDVVKGKLTSPAEVAKSRQLPMRFLSAYRAVPSNQWAQPLETALDLCLNSLPMFTGRTLILIDTSGSMEMPMSGKSQLARWDLAAMFGLALAARCHDADVVSFSDTTKVFPKVKGESLLKSIDRFGKGFFINHGTATTEAVRNHYRGHDRVVILTDEQADTHYGNRGVFSSVSADTMCITFNLAGYKMGHGPTGPKRVTIGGLSDAAFTLLPALEGRAQGLWPF